MGDVTGLFVFLLPLLVGRAGGVEPSNGYCIGTRCFTVFHHESGFTAAQDRCGDRGGHLMTVRSSVSHDILSILLGNLTGRYWIGLRLASGCLDSAAELRGFQWVTEDRESDFSNWPPGLNGSCSPSCVSVSHEDEFRWIPVPCGGPLAGFLCEYVFTDPCTGLATAPGESVTYSTPMGFVGDDVLSLPPGSTAVRMPAETKYVCYTSRWLQAPWSCEIHEGGCEYRCAVNPKHQPACFCPLGQTVSPRNQVTCEEPDADDPCAALRCAYACYRDGDSHACLCDHGFKLAADGRSCVDVNDCGDERQCPGDNVMCVNTVGGFQCVCAHGYVERGGLCTDADECASAPCEQLCDNTPGSYKCSCYDGYKEDPDTPKKCVLHCGEEECVAVCDPNNRFQCYCPDGYVSEERETHTVCIDMDECSFSYCDQGCENTFGSYVCACSPGYTLVGEYTCVWNEEGAEGSGQDAGTSTTSTSTPSPGVPTTAAAPPTRRPSAVSPGGLWGIIVCTVVFVLLLLFVAHRALCGGGKMKSSALKHAEDEVHGLERVAGDA